MTDIAWTDERIEQLRRLRAEGATFGEIARDIGCSRNAAIGKAGRLKLPSVVQHVAPRPPRREPKPTRQRRTRLVMRFEPKLIEPPKPEPLPAERIDDLAIPAEQRRQLLDLGNEHCRWPIGDPGDDGFFFCGSPDADCDAGKPYCRSHALIAFTKPRGMPFIPWRKRAA